MRAIVIILGLLLSIVLFRMVHLEQVAEAELRYRSINEYSRRDMAFSNVPEAVSRYLSDQVNDIENVRKKAWERDDFSEEYKHGFAPQFFFADPTDGNGWYLGYKLGILSGNGLARDTRLVRLDAFGVMTDDYSDLIFADEARPFMLASDLPAAGFVTHVRHQDDVLTIARLTPKPVVIWKYPGASGHLRWQSDLFISDFDGDGLSELLVCRTVLDHRDEGRSSAEIVLFEYDRAADAIVAVTDRDPGTMLRYKVRVESDRSCPRLWQSGVYDGNRFPDVKHGHSQ